MKPDLVVGERYLAGIYPGPPVSVTYLGPVPGWPRYSRIRALVSRKVIWVKTDSLRPFLSEVNAR